MRPCPLGLLGNATYRDTLRGAVDAVAGVSGLDAHADGHTAAMDRGDDVWLEALAGVQADVDAQLRGDAYEVFVAESARCRLEDRTGPAHVRLRSGHVIDGEIARRGPESVDAHLVLTEATGRRMLIPATAVLTIRGARPGLREEAGGSYATSLGSWLRDAWGLDDRMLALLSDGSWTGDRLVHVGADHVDLSNGSNVTTVPWAAVLAWSRG
jgi:hypothetical protein